MFTLLKKNLSIGNIEFLEHINNILFNTPYEGIKLLVENEYLITFNNVSLKLYFSVNNGHLETL